MLFGYAKIVNGSKLSLMNIFHVGKRMENQLFQELMDKNYGCYFWRNAMQRFMELMIKSKQARQLKQSKI